MLSSLQPYLIARDWANKRAGGGKWPVACGTDFIFSNSTRLGPDCPRGAESHRRQPALPAEWSDPPQLLTRENLGEARRLGILRTKPQILCRWSEQLSFTLWG